MCELPPLTKDLILHVDLTPDQELPLRILRAYRENCDSEFVVEGTPDKFRVIWEAMNQIQRERAAILDRAIKVLGG